MQVIDAQWPAPANIRAWVTTRVSGSSQGPYAAGNLGEHVGDDPGCVNANRAALLEKLDGVSSIQWLRQVHGNRVFCPPGPVSSRAPEADAIVTGYSGLACAVLTADCLPVCFSTSDGGRVAVAHAGWRGLSAGVLERTVTALDVAPSAVLAWLGPAIGPCHFEVGDDVRNAFLSFASASERAVAETAFQRGNTVGRWWADLYALARQRLSAIGVRQVYGGGLCTFCDPERFYSYRRDGVHSGRFATLIGRLP